MAIAEISGRYPRQPALLVAATHVAPRLDALSGADGIIAISAGATSAQKH